MYEYYTNFQISIDSQWESRSIIILVIQNIGFFCLLDVKGNLNGFIFLVRYVILAMEVRLLFMTGCSELKQFAQEASFIPALAGVMKAFQMSCLRLYYFFNTPYIVSEVSIRAVLCTLSWRGIIRQGRAYR